MGSTKQLLHYAVNDEATAYIVATEEGIFHDARFGTRENMHSCPLQVWWACQSCGHCPWMAMNQVDQISTTLAMSQHEVHVPQNIIAQAKISLNRMITFQG